MIHRRRLARSHTLVCVGPVMNRPPALLEEGVRVVARQDSPSDRVAARCAARTTSSVTTAPAASVGPSSPSVPPDKQRDVFGSRRAPRARPARAADCGRPCRAVLSSTSVTVGSPPEIRQSGPGSSRIRSAISARCRPTSSAGAFRLRGGDHRVRIAEPLGFDAGRIDGRRVVAEDEMRSRIGLPWRRSPVASGSSRRCRCK